MKVFKRIIAGLLIALLLAALGGYIYFDRKFTPDKNYLTVENESGPVELSWLGEQKNVLLLPIHFQGDTSTFYLQFDTGSPYSIFYADAIKTIPAVSVNGNLASAYFYLGKTKISSSKFKIYAQGKSNEKNPLKIIGTLGADILEDRKTLLNFKENYIAVNLSKAPTGFQNGLFDYKFSKRKIIFKGRLNGKEEKFLFDSGTSAYELLTNKEIWQKMKGPQSKIDVEESQSWDRVLTAYTATCNHSIKIANRQIPLNNITYVEGFSTFQYSMMKFSGMTGMLGNKIFLNNSLYFDDTQHKMGIR